MPTHPNTHTMHTHHGARLPLFLSKYPLTHPLTHPFTHPLILCVGAPSNSYSYRWATRGFLRQRYSIDAKITALHPAPPSTIHPAQAAVAFEIFVIIKQMRAKRLSVMKHKGIPLEIKLC